jgi:glycosyltransferase involved in cell wall biosynthesis/SAM-dependent methyltransferase
VRILVVADVSPAEVLGGGERFLREVSSRLVGRGHDVTVLGRSPHPEAAETVVRDRIWIRHFPVNRRALPAFARDSIVNARRAVTDELHARGADVLHLHQPLAALGALSATRDRLPSLYTFHSPAPLEYRWRRGVSRLHRGGLLGSAGAAFLWVVERLALSRASRIHVLSRYSARLVERLYRIGADRVTVIPGGVDLDRFRPAAGRRAVRRALGLPEDGTVLLTVRNLAPRMGLEALVEAMALLVSRHPGVLLLIGGEGALRAPLEALVASRGLARHVRMLGFVPESALASYYQAADAFVLPTRALEGFGLVTLEALACGTPVLGTPVGATPELLAGLPPSLTAERADAPAIARALDGLLSAWAAEAAAPAALRAACRAHVEERYGWPRAVEAIERELSGLADAGRATGVARCPACDVTAAPDGRYHGRAYGRCPRCGTLVLGALPTRDASRRQFETEYEPAVSRARATMLARLLDGLAPSGGGRRLLDLGCGGGAMLAAAAARGWQPFGADVAWPVCVAAQKASGQPVIQSDSVELPLADRSVDAVALVNVLDHVPDPVTALRECARVLVPGGRILVRATNGPFHRRAARALGQRSLLGQAPVVHLFAFTRRGLVTAVQRAGLSVVSVGPAALAGDRDDRVWLRRSVGACVQAAAIVSRGRWLIGPSLVLYARKPDAEARA